MRVTHTYADMVLARILATTAGYKDCDDVDTPWDGPVFKIAYGRAPQSGQNHISQPTLSVGALMTTTRAGSSSYSKSSRIRPVFPGERLLIGSAAEKPCGVRKPTR